jgi:deazaflavin-dependent oxidoreductase (nitroreductase family)
MDLSDGLKDARLKGMNLAHRTLLAVSGGRVGRRLGSMPVVELHTTGRTSGRRRSVMLTVPVHGDGRWVLVASKGGDDRHPDWYRNLVANPEAELTVDGTTVAVNTRTATDAEKAELWPRVVATYRGYAAYQTRTDRDIPLVICTQRPR